MRLTNRQKLNECLELLRDIQKWGLESATYLPGHEPRVIFTMPEDLRGRLNKVLAKRKDYA